MYNGKFVCANKTPLPGAMLFVMMRYCEIVMNNLLEYFLRLKNSEIVEFDDVPMIVI